MTYWDSDTGKFLGKARGSSDIFEFDASGHYKQYVYLEMRTYGLVTTAWTVRLTTNGMRRSRSQMSCDNEMNSSASGFLLLLKHDLIGPDRKELQSKPNRADA